MTALKTRIINAFADARPYVEYWLTLAIAAVAELWRPTGRHRRGWREPSTFDRVASEWGRMSLVVEAERQPVPEPVEAPKPPTIGDRARQLRAVGPITQEFERIIGVQLTQLGTGSHRERAA